MGLRCKLTRAPTQPCVPTSTDKAHLVFHVREESTPFQPGCAAAGCARHRICSAPSVLLALLAGTPDREC